MTLGCVRVFHPHGRMALGPLVKSFTLGGRPFNTLRGKHVLKDAESHCCKVNKRLLLVILARFLRFLKGTHFRNHLQNLNGVTDFSQANF